MFDSRNAPKLTLSELSLEFLTRSNVLVHGRNSIIRQIGWSVLFRLLWDGNNNFATSWGLFLWTTLCYDAWSFMNSSITAAPWQSHDFSCLEDLHSAPLCKHSEAAVDGWWSIEQTRIAAVPERKGIQWNTCLHTAACGVINISLRLSCFNDRGKRRS